MMLRSHVVDLRVDRFSYQLAVPDDDWIGDAITQAGRPYEYRLLDVTRQLVGRNDRVIDVGANIGNHTLFWSQVVGAMVDAVEPYGPSFELLCRNVSLNGAAGRVRSHNFAAGAHAGHADVALPDPTMLGTARVLDSDAGPVEVATLDAAFGAGAPVRLVKVDVEGRELDVLQGARGILAKHPMLILEAHTPADRSLLDDFLRPFGYRRLPLSLAASPTYLYTASPRDVLRAMRSRSLWARVTGPVHRPVRRWWAGLGASGRPGATR